MEALNKLKDDTAKVAFKMTKREAIAKGICINCKEKPKFYSRMGQKEYGISGLCEYCFDDICVDPADKCAMCNKPKTFHENKINRGECDEFRPKPSNYIGD